MDYNLLVGREFGKWVFGTCGCGCGQLTAYGTDGEDFTRRDLIRAAIVVELSAGAVDALIWLLQEDVSEEELIRSVSATFPQLIEVFQTLKGVRQMGEAITQAFTFAILPYMGTGPIPFRFSIN